MKLQFEINVGGTWVPTAHGSIQADGRLGFTLPGRSGVCPPPFWRHTEETTRQPEFRRMCFASLTPEERDSAVARLRGQPEF